MTTTNYITSVVRLMDICESELLFGTLPIAKTQRQYIKRVWMKNSVVEERIDSTFNRIEYLVNGKRHRTNGKPDIVYTDGTKYWFVNDKCYRVGGPAVMRASGDKHWYVNGKLHRIGGPASVHASGHKYWYINGKCHSTDGPAAMRANSTDWYINDYVIKLSNSGYKR